MSLVEAHLDSFAVADGLGVLLFWRGSVSLQREWYRAEGVVSFIGSGIVHRECQLAASLLSITAV